MKTERPYWIDLLLHNGQAMRSFEEYMTERKLSLHDKMQRLIIDGKVNLAISCAGAAEEAAELVRQLKTYQREEVSRDDIQKKEGG